MKRFKALDRQLTDKIEAWGRPHLAVWRFIAGNGMWLLALVAIFSVWQEKMHVLHFFLPLMLAYATVLALQNIIRRERPREEVGTDYKLWYRTFSCPSAHAMTSAAYATVLAFVPMGGTVAQIVLVALLVAITLIVGLSRLIVGVHYLFDVVLGLFLGALFGLGYILVFSL